MGAFTDKGLTYGRIARTYRSYGVQLGKINGRLVFTGESGAELTVRKLLLSAKKNLVIHFVLLRRSVI